MPREGVQEALERNPGLDRPDSSDGVFRLVQICRNCNPGGDRVFEKAVWVSKEERSLLIQNGKERSHGR